MSRLEVPLLGRFIRATGDVLIRGELELLLRDSSGGWSPETFLADSGTEMTTMPANDANNLGLPLPQNPVRGLSHAQTGLAIRNGYLRIKVVGMDATEYVIPCYFLGDPDAPPPANQPQGLLPRKLLGLTGVIDKLEIGFTGKTGPGAQFGYLIVEKV
jgi:hypothetical protein